MSSRPPSGVSIGSKGSTNFDELAALVRPMQRTYSPSSPRVSGTFVDLRGSHLSTSSLTSLTETDVSSDSRRSSLISISSASTITSTSPTNLSAQQENKRLSTLISDVHRAEEGGEVKLGIGSDQEMLVPPMTKSPDGSIDSTPTSSQDEPVFDTPV